MATGTIAQTTTPQLTLADFPADVHDKLAPIFERLTQERIANEQDAQAWRARKLKKFTDLSFVGAAYLSRNRRSADKTSAWAVPTPPSSLTGRQDAVEQGVIQGIEFCQCMVDNLSNVSGGVYLTEVIMGMADALAKADDREGCLARIRGFASVLEAACVIYLTDGSNQPDHRKQQVATHRTADNQEFAQMIRVNETYNAIYYLRNKIWGNT